MSTIAQEVFQAFKNPRADLPFVNIYSGCTAVIDFSYAV